MSKKSIVLFLFISKITYALFAFFVFSKFSQLGDTDSYLSGHYLYRNDFSSSAYILSLIGNALGSLGGTLFSITLSIIGILYPLNKARLRNKHLKIILFLSLLPSFGVWSSILSKEVFVVFSMGICVGGMIDMHRKKRKFFSFFECISLFILIFFKPHYSLAVVFSVFIIWLYNNGVNGLYAIATSVFLSYVVIVVAVYFEGDITSYALFLADNYFVDGASTRVNDFWIERFDFFTYSILGVPKAFIGPTFAETISRIQFLPYLVEGVLLFGMIIWCSLRSAFYHRKVNVLCFSLFISFTLLLMFVHYPVGILNPGSSIRYRSGFIMPLCIFVIYLYQTSRDQNEKNTFY